MEAEYKPVQGKVPEAKMKVPKTGTAAVICPSPNRPKGVLFETIQLLKVKTGLSIEYLSPCQLS